MAVQDRKRIAFVSLLLLSLLAFSGCAATKEGNSETHPEPEQVKVEQMDAVSKGSGEQVILSLHKRFASTGACKFGLTLTNTLPHPITNIAFRFAAYAAGETPHQEVLRNFFEIDPAASQYREVIFSGVTCDQIRYVQVTDPGRCTMGKLERSSSQPGECIRFVHVAENPFVKLVQK